jgi:phosphate transport system substrate-binding protein
MTQSLSGAGSTFSAPLYQQWIKVYERERPSVAITYDVVGSGEGVRRFVAGSVDFGASDVVLSDSEVAEVSRGVVMVPATAGLVVLAYNLPGLNGKLRLPRDVYPGIFSGAVRYWDDPRIQKANPGLVLSHRNIAIVARQDSSGTTDAFTNHLAAIDRTWRARGLGVGKFIQWPAVTIYGRGNEGVASWIKIAKGSIGYVEYGFAKRLGLPMAVLQNKVGSFVEPSLLAGQLALAEADASPKKPEDLDLSIVDPSGSRAYPIVTFSWLLLYRQYADPAKGAAVRDFAAWGLSSGQSFSKEFGYIPLPNAAVASGRRALAGIGR